MRKLFVKFVVFVASLILLSYCGLFAQDITLPPPQKTGGMPLMEALNNRKTTRAFADREIPVQVLSDLLWAAYGFNRPEERKRTVPSAWNVQNMEVYVATVRGLYLYDAAAHSLKLIVQEDVRAQTGTQTYAGSAPVNLIYVANMSLMRSAGDRAEFYSAAHAGFIGQNVYLFCASAGLGAVVRDLIDRETLRKVMKLGEDRAIILAQTVGYQR